MDTLNRLKVNENLQCSDVASYFNEVLRTLEDVHKSNRSADVDALLEKVTEILSLKSESVFYGDILTEIFRFLRNFVAWSVTCQDAVVKNRLLLELAIEQIISLTSLLDMNECSESDLLRLKCAVQFLGNLVTNNSHAKQVIWKKTFPLFRSWLEGRDVSLRKYSAMLFYNCVLDAAVHRDEVLNSHSDGLAIVQLLINCTTKDECEWGLYTIENLLESSTFIDSLYLSVPQDSRLALLDIICEKLAQKSTMDRIPCEIFLFVAKQFEAKADVILTIKENLPNANDAMEPVEVVKFLEVLCLASTKPSYSCHLRECTSLLISSLFLLKSIHVAGKETSNIFTSVERLSLTTRSVENTEMLDHPVNGFKKNLIRLIANLCWRHKVNQDKVRELDGIPLLLDCCKLDARNPFIIQWVVFAIRNLCEDNPENQQLIASMELQGTVDSAVLNEIGVTIELDSEQGKPVLRAANGVSVTREEVADTETKTNDEQKANSATKTREERARDDIRDLMS